MKATRRHMLTSGALAALGGGFLSRLDQVAGQQGGSSSSLTDMLKQQASDASLSKLIKPKAGAEGPPQPAYFDRLPLEWNKRTVTRFKKKLAEQGLQAFLVRDRLNIIYLTGYWHTTTERPQSVFMNKDDTDPWYFYPSLDRDLVRTWWFGGGREYFDFHHGRGAFPHESRVQQGEKVDLFEFMLEGVKAHGIQGTKIGIDGELYPSELEKVARVLPGIEFVDVSDVLMGMRQVKTPEELALWRRAYVYFDRAHAFARDYILTHGTDVTDYEVKLATELWINDQLYSDIDLADGAAHRGVFTGVHLGVRVGPVTAYPHPNQPSYNRIEKGAALQVAGLARIGGYGHQGQRTLNSFRRKDFHQELVAPSGDLALSLDAVL